MNKYNSEAIDLLVSMAPEENKMKVAQLLKKYERFNNQDDPVYQVMLQLAIYQKFQSRFPGELKEAADRIENCTEAFIKGAEVMAKIERNTSRSYIVHGIFLLIMLLFVSMYSCSLDKNFEKYTIIQEHYSSELEKERMKGQDALKTTEEISLEDSLKELEKTLKKLDKY